MSDCTFTQQIQEFLSRLFVPGDVFEVRAPDCHDRPDAKFAFTTSGYFTYDAIDEAAGEVAELDRAAMAPGVYVTLNPVSPSLLARSANRIKPRTRATTTDGDIIRRRNLLVDLDPVRPSGVSSTDDELLLAHDLARSVLDYLRDLGWPEPMVGMSGNGWHLIYRIDLPADDGDLVKNVLESLAKRFDTLAAAVDRSVHNPSRISKLLGTMVRKGDDLQGVPGIEDRPHRRSKIVELPDVRQVVPVELLEAVAGVLEHREPAGVTATTTAATPRLECTPSGVRTWLEAHGVTVTGERRNGTKTLLLLEACPINSEIVSTGGSDIAVLVGDDGMLSYCNKHNRGEGYTWQDLRRVLEPGYEPKPKEGSDVDLSSFMTKVEDEDPPPHVERPVDPGPFPEHLLCVPGFIDAVVQYNLQTATRPQPVLALAGAIVLQAVLAGRKIRDERGNRTNLYCLGIAPSGSGKDNARKVSKNILFAAGLDHLEGSEDLASDAGVVTAVERQPAILFQVDEIGRMLKTIGDPKKAPHLFNLLGVLMKLYSSADTVFRGKAYADHKRNRVVDQPCACVYGTSVPAHFFESLTIDSLHDGFVARLLVFEATDTPDRVRAKQQDPPDNLVEAARWWGTFRPGGNLRSEHPDPDVVPYTHDAEAVFDAFAKLVDAELKKPDHAGRSMWARAEEKACRLALVYACSVNREEPVVDEPAATWACELASYLTRRMLSWADEWVADGAFDARQKKVLRIIRSNGGVLTRNELCRKTQWLTQRERQELIGNMIETGQIIMNTVQTSKRIRIEYVA